MGDLTGGRAWYDYYAERRNVQCPGCRHQALSHADQGSALFPDYYCGHTIHYRDQDGFSRSRPCGCTWSFADMKNKANQDRMEQLYG